MLASVVEGQFLAHHRLHATHTWRKFCVFDVQFDVSGELAGMAV